MLYVTSCLLFYIVIVNRQLPHIKTHDKQALLLALTLFLRCPGLAAAPLSLLQETRARAGSQSYGSSPQLCASGAVSASLW